MKRILWVILIGVLAVPLAACGGKEAPAATEDEVVAKEQAGTEDAAEPGEESSREERKSRGGKELAYSVPDEYMYVEQAGEGYYLYYDEEAGIDRYLEIDAQQLSRSELRNAREAFAEDDIDGLMDWIFDGDLPGDLQAAYKSFDGHDGYYMTYTYYGEDFYWDVYEIYILVDDWDFWIYGETDDDTMDGMIADMEFIISTIEFV